MTQARLSPPIAIHPHVEIHSVRNDILLRPEALDALLARPEVVAIHLRVQAVGQLSRCMPPDLALVLSDGADEELFGDRLVAGLDVLQTGIPGVAEGLVCVSQSVQPRTLIPGALTAGLENDEAVIFHVFHVPGAIVVIRAGLDEEYDGELTRIERAVLRAEAVPADVTDYLPTSDICALLLPPASTAHAEIALTRALPAHLARLERLMRFTTPRLTAFASFVHPVASHGRG